MRRVTILGMSTKRNGTRATIADVADEAGVSKGLVSLAFKDASKVGQMRRERIFRAAEKLGYQPNFVARSLATKRSSFIGILLSNMHNPLFPEIAEAARQVFEEAGWHSLITSASAPSDPSDSTVDAHLAHMFRDLRPSGALVVGTLSEGRVLPPETPLTFASSVPPPGAEGAVVRVDDHAGIALAVDHLMEQGRQRIAFAGGEGGAVSRHRLRAYQEVARTRGLDPVVLAADLTEESGVKAFNRVVDQGHLPDAVVAVNDLAAIGVQTAADQAGFSLPEDLAVVGFDNTFLSALRRISLTSVDPQNVQVGHRAARSLLSAMAGGGGGQEQLVVPELVVRDSSGPGPAH